MNISNWIYRLGLSLMVSCFLLHTTPVLAGIPEPGIVLYGQVKDDTGTLITSGTLTWTYAPVSGGDPFTFSTELKEIEDPAGPFSYSVLIPLETAVPGHPVSADALPLSKTIVAYNRSARIEGTGITLNDIVSIGISSRGSVEVISIYEISGDDLDGDGLPDAWEQSIVDADPDDGITAIGQVNPGDDFDQDGENNLAEHNHDTDPADPLSTMIGDLDGDKYITIGDSIVALKVLSNADYAGEPYPPLGDIDGDGKIGLAEIANILQKVSGTRR